VIKIPYIKKEKREKFDGLIKQLAGVITSIGEVNYVITKFLHTVIEDDKSGLCYAILNSLIGVVECVKLELYRMVVTKYEDKKRMQTGPISDLDAKSLEDVR
jgi:hypothetical protein